MVSDQSSRRDALHLSTVVLLGLAGCSTQSDAERQSTSTPTVSKPEYSHSMDSPDSTKVRNPNGEPAVRSSTRSPEENLFESTASWNYENWVVTSSGGQDALSFARATTGVEAATDFAAHTDFSEETLLIHQYNIGKCETRQPTRLRWGNGFTCGDVSCAGISLNYDQDTPSSGCQETATASNDSPPYSEGSYDNESTFVRIPAQIQSYERFRSQV